MATKFKLLFGSLTIIVLVLVVVTINQSQWAGNLPVSRPTKTEPKALFLFGGTIESITNDGLVVMASAKQNFAFAKDRRYYVAINNKTNITPGLYNLIISTRRNEQGEIIVETKVKDQAMSNNAPQAAKVSRWQDLPVGSYINVVGTDNIMINESIVANWLFY